MYNKLLLIAEKSEILRLHFESGKEMISQQDSRKKEETEKKCKS